MPETISSREFVTKWSRSTLKESSAAQQQFLDICRLIGYPPPADVDPDGEWFTFEVLDAYGWAHDIDDEKILRQLLELNLERASSQD